MGRSRHRRGLRQAPPGISTNAECCCLRRLHLILCGVETIECRTRELLRQIKPFVIRPCIPRDMDEHRALHAAGKQSHLAQWAGASSVSARVVAGNGYALRVMPFQVERLGADDCNADDLTVVTEIGAGSTIELPSAAHRPSHDGAHDGFGLRARDKCAGVDRPGLGPWVERKHPRGRQRVR